jgi:hypothetical protein
MQAHQKSRSEVNVSGRSKAATYSATGKTAASYELDDMYVTSTRLNRSNRRTLPRPELREIRWMETSQTSLQDLAVVFDLCFETQADIELTPGLCQGNEATDSCLWVSAVAVFLGIARIARRSYTR